MIAVPAGSFRMGGADGQDEQPVHDVTVRRFAMGTMEVTERQWKALMGTDPLEDRHCGGDCPVGAVSWDQVQVYLRKLSRKTGQRYRLPSEAEWEYACRAGKRQKYCGGDELDPVAWFAGNSAGRSRPVGENEPNAFGLSDMSGSVYEWVQDCSNKNYVGAPADGSAWLTGNCAERVLRGGSWANTEDLARPSSRVVHGRDQDDVAIFGFRVARDLKP